MLKKILETIGTRYLIAIFNLGLIFINARVLGLTGVGIIGLIIASVNIGVVINGILCGNTLVYFMRKYRISTLMIPAYLWTIIGSALACTGILLSDAFSSEYYIHIYLLAMLNSLVTANSRFLLGKQDIRGFNIIHLIQGGLLFFIVISFYYIANKQEVYSYIWSIYITNGLALTASGYLLIPYIKKESESSLEKHFSIRTLIKEMFKYGLWAGADNLAEVLTTRLNYFLLQYFYGLNGVGLLDAGTKISESVWHISRSTSNIEYSKVTNENSSQKQIQITLRLFKLTFCALVLIIGLILLIPETIYTKYLFSPDFAGIKYVIFGLSVGCITLGSNSIISHYFIGTGKIRYSTFCSFFGLFLLLISGYFFIPAYGAIGSALSSSIAFTGMLVFSIVIFKRITRISITDLMPTHEDFSYLSEELQKLFNHH